jgi:uncharacterized phage infection (PIP) family protein YhgE
VAGIDDRIEQSKNWFERIAEHVPGYKGYKDKELRREADKTQRLFVAERLDTVAKKLDDIKLDLVNRAQLDKLGAIDLVSRKLRTLTDKIRYADYGYAGLFDTDKVDEPILDQLYQFDNNLLTGVQEIETLAGALNADGPTLTNDIALLQDKIEALGTQFAEREHLITGAGR